MSIKYKDPLTREWINTGGYGGTSYVNGVSVKKYGAKGDGVTDDTVAFQTALAENRVVLVPGGTYVLSATLTIGSNSELELSQDTVLNFTQTDSNGIEMKRLANLCGNHATINVPYAFAANVIHISTENDNGDATDAVPPFTRWSPQWKMSRYITDVNICKADYRGFHYSVDGDCYGNALYINCNESDDFKYMWGVTMSGIRIAGGFVNGIYIHNEGTAWNHDMRIEAVIDACETGVLAENCNNMHLDVTFQPRRALNTDGVTYVPYAKWGIKLVDCLSADLSQAAIWDWNSTNTLYGTNEEYKFLALYGECAGTILNDFSYYQQADVRLRIYTDTESNLEKITILQEPFTRWFKPIDNEPYFYDGNANKKLMLATDKFYAEQMEFIHTADGYYTYEEDFNNVKEPYQDGTRFNPATGAMEASSNAIFMEAREFSVGDVIRIRGINYANGLYPFMCFFNKSDGSYKGVFNFGTLISGGTSGSLTSSAGTYEWDASTYTLTVRFDNTNSAAMCEAYTFSIGGTYASGYDADSVILTVNEEIDYTAVWHGKPRRIEESIYAQNVYLSSPNGTGYKITVADDGTLSAEVIE